MIILTPQERRALVFIGAVFFIGLCGQAMLKLYPPGYRAMMLLDKPPVPRIIDVNHASYEELLSVPGVGPSVAARIIHAREAGMHFYSVDDLRKIKGFSSKNRLRASAYLEVGAP